MNGDWLENKLNDRLQNFESEFNGEEAWQELSVRRQSNKRKRWAVLWWYGLGLLVLMGIAVFFVEKNKVIAKPKGEIAQQAVSPVLKVHDNIVENISVNDQDYKQKEPESSMVLEAKNVFLKSIKPKVIQPENEEISTIFEYDKREDNSQKIPEIKKAIPIISNEKYKGAAKYLPNPPSYVEGLKNNAGFNFVNNTNNKERNNYRNGIGVFVGYGMHFRTLSGSSTEFEDIVSYRIENEREIDAWEVSFFYRKRLFQDLFVESGLGFMSTTYKFTDNYTQTAPKLIEDHLITINRYPDGSEEQLRGTTSGVITEKVRSKYYQRHQELFAKLMFGIEQPLAKELSIRLATGIEYSFLRSSRGPFSSKKKPLSVDGIYIYYIEYAPYGNNGILTGILRFDLAKTIFNRHEVSLSFSGKAMLTNAMKNDDHIEKRYYLMGKIGYLRHF